ncbi:MAG: FAD-dependent oxidoreductase [Lachnospiraceae bacterium]|nr:FAD-dependent oxidoreductase [Lachnospiraceae bacterium]
MKPGTNTVVVQKNIPVAYEVDVAVVGGGPAGVAAAVAAAREGIRVLLIEQTNCLGGIATAGWHGHICMYCSQSELAKDRIVGGFCYEITQDIVREGYGSYDNWALDFEVERLKYILEKKVSALENLRVLYYTQFVDVLAEDGRIETVIIQNKSGLQAVKAGIVIDCTGDGDVATRAGAEYEMGRPGDGAIQPMTLMFQIGGVDYPRYDRFWREEYPKRYGAFEWGHSSLWRDLQEKGLMEPFQNHTCGIWWTPTRPDQVGVNFTHIFAKDPTDAEDLTYATMEGRRQAYETVEIFRRFLPGFENSWLSHTAQLIGTRESRRILGDYFITTNDLYAHKQFEDSIGYGSFFFDVHNCTDIGMDQETEQPPEGFRYQIPYRALIPRTLKNVLVAGRCISCDHHALGSLRVMPQCFIEGDAAGTAAAIALMDGTSIRKIGIAKLQNTLRAHGSIVAEEDIVTIS